MSENTNPERIELKFTFMLFNPLRVGFPMSFRSPDFSIGAIRV